MVDQLKDHGYITIKKLPLPYRPIQIISPMGSAWLKRTERLILKAKPEMYPYFRKKKKFVQIASIQPSTSNQATVNGKGKMEVAEDGDDGQYKNDLELSDKHLEEILLGIRAALAENSDCMPYLVASNRAIQQMVEMKPISIKEFKLLIVDGFSIAKIDKFASVFIDGIIKFMVS